MFGYPFKIIKHYIITFCKVHGWRTDAATKPRRPEKQDVKLRPTSDVPRVDVVETF